MASRSPGRAAEPSRSRERFGKYEILRRIATGGMAEIHLARSQGIEGFEKLVVLKRILPQYARDDEFVTMFLDEARLAATLHHTNIVQVFDMGEERGHYYLAMEFLHGRDAQQAMKAAHRAGQRLPLEHALTIMQGVLSGLHYAHERMRDGKPLELVHRDVSPQNIFVTYEGGVKLLDFGIARAASRSSVTRAGTLKGKVSYMSPEQCMGLPLDRRSDIFSASIVLWELSTGRRLYGGDSELEIMRKVKEEDAPRPSLLSFAYPLAVERILLKGLKRDREERYQTAEQMLVELEDAGREAKLPMSPVSLSRYMRELFHDQVEAWREAERSGLELGDHIVQTSASGQSLVRTDTSVPGPAAELVSFHPPVLPPEPRRVGRAVVY